jgi:hypothetical protein
LVIKDLYTVVLSECRFRENHKSGRDIPRKGLSEILHLLPKIHVDFSKAGVSILHKTFFAFMSFRENGRKESHVSTGVNIIKLMRISISWKPNAFWRQRQY